MKTTLGGFNGRFHCGWPGLLGGLILASLVAVPHTSPAAFEADAFLKAPFNSQSNGVAGGAAKSGANFTLTLGIGGALAVDGNTLVVGARTERGTNSGAYAFGPSGDPNVTNAWYFQSLANVGCVLVYTNDGNNWIGESYMKPEVATNANQFGYAVAISGDTMVVGAPFEWSGASGVNGDQTDRTATNSGAAWVFVRSAGTWVQQAYLKAHNPDVDDNFGVAVGISGDTIVVGAYREDSGATGAFGPDAWADAGTNSTTEANSGAAYVFVRNGTTWTQQAYLKASNTGGGDNFGNQMCVGISGDTIVIGATSEDSNATGVNGDQSDNGASGAGAAYVFVRNGTTWSQQAYLKASNTEASDRFDRCAISGDTIVVTAFQEDSNATTVNGNQSNNDALSAGAAYVFVRNGTIWSQQAYLKGSKLHGDTVNANNGDRLGISVAISGNRVVLGADRDDGVDAAGTRGSNTDNHGAAYVFERSGTTWTETGYLKHTFPGAGDVFGGSVGISGNTVAVAAESDDSNAFGVNDPNSVKLEIAAASLAGDGNSELTALATSAAGPIINNTLGNGTGAVFVFAPAGSQRFYQLERAVSLTPPVAWTALTNNLNGTTNFVADPGGNWTHTDLYSTNYAERYYRAASIEQ